MKQRQHRRIFWILVIVLAVFHVDFFNHGEIARRLFWEWLPLDLAYHVVWVILAAVLVLYFTRYVWRDYDGS